MKLDSKLKKSLHYIWLSIIDFQNAQQLHELPYSYKNIKYQVWKPVSTESVRIADEVYFSGFANERMLLLQILHLATEKLLKGLIILYNHQSGKPPFSPSGNGHTLLEMWNYLPNDLKVTFGAHDYGLPIKGEIEKLIDMPSFLSLDYNIIRYGVDRHFKVSNFFDLTVSTENLGKFINRMHRIGSAAGSCIFSIKPALNEFLTGDDYPKVIALDHEGNEMNGAGQVPLFLRFTNKSE